MADVKIPALPTATSVATTDYVIKDDGAATSKITVANFLSSFPWTDYSTTSTIVGWTTFTTKELMYCVIGRMVFVYVYLAGTSNSTLTSFSLPATIDSTNVLWTVALGGTDNGTALVAPAGAKPTSVTVVSVYKDFYSAAWTNSGTKIINGQFWYYSL
jgi:hypothetical protein